MSAADARLKSLIDRILRCREAEDEAKEDTKAVYAEAKGEGYDKTAMGQLVTYLRKKEKNGEKLAEQSAIFDLYLTAYERPSHAHTREGAEITESNQATGTGGGDVDRSAERVGHPGQDWNALPGQDRESENDTTVETFTSGPDAKRVSPSDGDAIAAVKGKARLANAAGVEPSPSDQFEPPAFLARQKTMADYRPHCLEPEACRSSKLEHCYTCRKALEATADHEVAA